MDIPRLIDANFASIESQGLNWRSHIYEMASTGDSETVRNRCALKCFYDSNSECNYFVWENNYCWLGNINADNSAIGWDPYPYDNFAVAHVYTAATTAQVSNYFSAQNKFGDNLWPKFISAVRKTDLVEVCAAFCRLYRKDFLSCQIFFHDASLEYCYLGSFDYVNGGILGTTAGPYYVNNDFGE